MVVEIEFVDNVLDFHEPIPRLQALMEFAHVDVAHVQPSEDGRTARVAAASAAEVGRLVDAVFRWHFEIRPFDGEHDYAFGAEWLSGEPAE
jgi:hypothetical protein